MSARRSYAQMGIAAHHDSAPRVGRIAKRPADGCVAGTLPVFFVHEADVKLKSESKKAFELSFCSKGSVASALAARDHL